MRTSRVPLKRHLDTILQRYGRRDFLESDPISVPHRYDRRQDRELSGFVAAMLAFGNVKSMLPAIRSVFAFLGPEPASALLAADDEQIRAGVRGIRYRWVEDRDLANLLIALRQVLVRDGSLETSFASGMPAGAGTVQGGLTAMFAQLRSAVKPGALERYGTRYLLPDGASRGASKRGHLFLRWMVRHDEIDFGLWNSATPRQLTIPLDTHVARISRYLGLSDRKTADLRMAREITDGLRELDPGDPVKYDFALSRLGILKACPSRPLRSACKPCPLKPACRYWTALSTGVDLGL